MASTGSRIYTDRITLNPPVAMPGAGAVNFYAVDADPNGQLDASAGDRAWQIGSSAVWVCTGGTVWEEASGGAPAPFVILRPAGPADPTAGVYTTFAEAHAAAEVIAATGAPTTIYVDVAAAFDPVPVLASTFDFYGLINVASYLGVPYTLETVEGTVFENFQRGFSTAELVHAGTAPLVTITAAESEAVWVVGPDAGIAQSGGGAVYAFSNAGTVTFRLLDGSYTYDGGGGAAFDATTSIISFLLSPGVDLDTDTVSGDGGSGLNLDYEAEGSAKAQSAFLGTITRRGMFPETSYNVAAPASGVVTSIGASANYRTVFGSLQLAASGGNAASIQWEVETGDDTGVYTAVAIFTQAAGDTTTRSYGYTFVVPARRRYRNVRGGLGGTTETINRYNVVDSNTL